MSIGIDDCVELLQELIRIPSLPGEEGELAAHLAGRMGEFGYDEVEIDEVGNVLGVIRGRGEAPAVMFNTHLDHVDVGDPERWPFPPFDGAIHNECVWGRGAVDIKGPMAAQVCGVARVAAGEPPPGDVWVTAVVQEEIGGVGARHLASRYSAGSLSTPIVVVGEPSRNTLRRGHRGRTELIAHFKGRSVHASVPENGINPLYLLAEFLARLDKLEMPEDPVLGASTVAPTLLETDQTSANVVPGEVWQTCDWRNIPGQSGEDVQRILEDLARGVLAAHPELAGATIDIDVPVFERQTYTGLDRPIPAANPAYALAPDDPVVGVATKLCVEALGEERPNGVWQFATDGGHFALVGMTPIGFGPGDEFLAHTVDEHIEIAALEEAMQVNEAFARRLAADVAALG